MDTWKKIIQNVSIMMSAFGRGKKQNTMEIFSESVKNSLPGFASFQTGRQCVLGWGNLGQNPEAKKHYFVAPIFTLLDSEYFWNEKVRTQLTGSLCFQRWHFKEKTLLVRALTGHWNWVECWKRNTYKNNSELSS